MLSARERAVRRKVNKAIQLAAKRDKTSYSSLQEQFKHNLKITFVRG